MVVRVQRYYLDTINRLMYEGFDYELDADVIDTVQMLSDQVGAPEYVRTPQFPKNNRHYEPTSNASKGGGRRNRYLNGGGGGNGNSRIKYLKKTTRTSETTFSKSYGKLSRKVSAKVRRTRKKVRRTRKNVWRTRKKVRGISSIKLVVRYFPLPAGTSFIRKCMRSFTKNSWMNSQ